jgi:hypothetical protein
MEFVPPVMMMPGPDSIYTPVQKSGATSDLDDLADKFGDEEPGILSDCNPKRFDRRQVNRALGKLVAGSYEEAVDEIHSPAVDRIPRRAATQRPSPDD